MSARRPWATRVAPDTVSRARDERAAHWVAVRCALSAKYRRAWLSAVAAFAAHEQATRDRSRTTRPTRTARDRQLAKGRQQEAA